MFRGAFLAILFVSTVAGDKVLVARWCTISSAEYQKCKAMKVAFAAKNLTPRVECVERSTVENCLITIREGEADLITLDGGDVFKAGKVFGLKPIMKEIYSSGSGYYGIAVTKAGYHNVTLNNLKGARTCHTGVGRTAGWNIPIGYLLNSGQMKSLGCKDHVKSAANFFSKSCAPGAMTSSYNPSRANVSNLCQICSGDCSRDPDKEPYNGYSGALRCLIEGQGEVAFIKPATIESNIESEDTPPWAKNVTANDLRLLCKDGTNTTIDNAANCHISKGVSHTVMVSESTTEEDITAYQDLLAAANTYFHNDSHPVFTLFNSSAWGGRNLIFKDYTVRFETVVDMDYGEYLGGYGESFEGLHKCPDNTIRFCTVSEQEQQKCRVMRDAFQNAELSPEISCFPTSSHAECIDNIAAGLADLVTLDGGDIYRAGKDHGLVPVLGEVYSGTGGNQPVSYWAVAVAKKSSNITMKTLKGKRSCHTGIMKTSGWVMPVGYLVGQKEEGEEGIEASMVDGQCGVTAAVGNFFSSSCAPGAKTREYDLLGTNPESLCENCVGKDEDNCVRNSHEPYYGYAGAFRCLVEGKGDVAFVKHTTVRDNTIPNGQEEWNENLRQKGFELLCPDGTRKDPWKYRQCNLGKVPSHALMTSKDKKPHEISQMITLLQAGVGLFGRDEYQGFRLFNSTGFHKDGTLFHYLDSEGQPGQNLLFKDSTVALRSVSSRAGRNYATWLGNKYLKALDAINCVQN